ncbi:MAG: deoxyribose-phosphate aldolase [Deltaproteobacteria bacterium]|jgi:deoxyribose-phosphate aldolase|nr:deoxyribose-phosphate aldolase [Deltaproteobacteria bacterium]MCW9049813.1 deoxyribose-phosphate aldolase [Deltaproteobacteria bacterium]
MNNPASFIDHTLLSPTTTEIQVSALCEEAVEYGFATVCIPPVFVPLAAARLYGSQVKVCSVVGFPCGYSTCREKVQETSDLIAHGAKEIDMVVQIGYLLGGNFKAVEDEIAQIVIAANRLPVKVIIECCYLSTALMQTATELVVKAGADFVKTSTGFGPSGATLDDVKRLVGASAGRIAVKAAGGIRTLDECRTFIEAGAARIGTSSGVAIVAEWQRRELVR